MELRERHVVGGGIVLLSALASVVAYPRLPAELVTHWGPEGPNGTMGRTVALVGIPLLAAAMLGLFEALPRIDPLGEHIRDLGRYYDALVVVTVGLVGYVHGVVIAWNLGYAFDVMQAVAPAVAVIYYVAGVVMARVDKNWFVGVRTPWTLSSDRVWERTHERAGPLFKVAGVVALGAVLLPEYGTYFVVAPAVAVSLYLAAYSYVAYSRLGSEPDGSV